MNWREQAACLGMPDIFVPVRQTEANVERARAICDSCPVQAECHEYAYKIRPSVGVWAGMTREQRRVAWRRTDLEEAA